MVRLSVLIALELAVVVFLALRLAAPIAEAAPVGTTQTAVDAALPTPTAERIDGAQRVPAARPGDAPPAQRDEVAARWNADDPVGVLLCGTVHFADGSAVEQPSVYLEREAKGVSVGVTDGAYAVCGLVPGTWQATVRATGAVDCRSTIELSDAAAQTHDFVLEPSFPVRVHLVTADGKDATAALRDAKLYALDLHVVGQRERFPDRMAPTDYGVLFVGDARWDGERNPKDGFAGTLHFAKAPPAYAALLLRNVVLAQQQVQPRQTEITFTVDVDAVRAQTGSATVRVLDAETGAPIPEARVGLDSSNRGGRGRATDGDGRLTIENLPPGLLQMQVTAKDHETAAKVVTIEPGRVLDLGEIRLGPVLPLVGRVLDADGKPCASATLQWTELKWRTEPTEFRHNFSTRTEADGTFQLWGSGRGIIAVRARGSDGQLAVGVFDNPPATPVELRLGAPATLKVLRPDDLTRSFTVTLFDAQRRPIEADTYEPRAREFSLTMPAGTYHYEVHDSNGAMAQSGAVTLGSEAATLEIR